MFSFFRALSIIEYIQLKERILFKDLETIVVFFTELINVYSVENLLKQKKYTIFFDTLYKKIEKNIENKKIYDFFFYLGRLFRILGFLNKSEIIYLNILNSIKVIEKNEIYPIYSELGHLYELMGEYNQAESYTNKAISSIDIDKDENIAEVITLKINLAKIYEEKGKYNLSEKSYLDILDFLVNKLNLEDVEIEQQFNIYHNLGVLTQIAS